MSDKDSETGLRSRTGASTAAPVNGNSNGSAAADAIGAADDGGGGGDARVLGVVFVAVAGLLVTLYYSLPPLDAADAASLTFPIRSLSELQQWSAVLLRYKKEHFEAVLAGFCAIYIFLQMFAIPGAIFLSVLAGPLFGVVPGLIIVSIVATTGASMCYGLSNYLGRGLVSRCLPGLLAQFRRSIVAQRHNLFWYLLFLRVSPLLPNWFINVASPILNIPLSTFAAATFVGLILPNYLHVTTGLTLSEVKELSEITQNYRRLAFLFVVAFVMLIPTLFKRKFNEINDRLSGVTADQPTGNGTAPAADSTALATSPHAHQLLRSPSALQLAAAKLAEQESAN